MPQAETTDHRAPLRVGLVNNMPDAALSITERQFRNLLQAAAPGRAVVLDLFEIPEIARSPDSRARMAERYRPVDDLHQAAIEVLVVTGADPGGRPLREADFWPGLTKVADWAVAQACPTLWSCLAAHAAAEHLDGVPRRRLPAKISGVYPCTPTAPDPLTQGLGARWMVPHSHYNDVSEADLIQAGYRILSRSPVAGVDIFSRPGTPQFLFLQGHPEYDHESLSLEFRRDLRAFVEGERDSLPDVPANLYSPDIEAALRALRDAAIAAPSSELLSRWPARDGLSGAPAPWRDAAVRLCANWLVASRVSGLELAGERGLKQLAHRHDALVGIGRMTQVLLNPEGVLDGP